ncbi:hypothetical protein ABKN59_005010 [Abortiporus biennis]
MSNKGRSTPRVVCCAIPIARAAGKVLLVTSRKRKDSWVLPKGGWEPSDGVLEAAASREALEEAGVRGKITRFVTTIPSASSTYHFYELDVTDLDRDWLESKERRRESFTVVNCTQTVTATTPTINSNLKLQPPIPTLDHHQHQTTRSIKSTFQSYIKQLSQT